MCLVIGVVGWNTNHLILNQENRRVMIPAEIIEKYNPTKLKLPADTFLFMEGDLPRFYYQIISGQIKMININADGKEFMQGQFEERQSFGEPPIFHNAPYPASAKTVDHTVLYKLHRDKFFQLLKEHPDLHLELTSMLTKRMMYKAMIMKEMSNHDAKHRILTFIDYLKKEYGSNNEPFLVNLTRQELSNLLGIRVETVIRTVKQLGENGEVELKGRKIIR